MKLNGKVLLFKLENKGIVLKARWFVRPDKTRARPLFKWNDEGIARVISRNNNGHARVVSGPTNHLALKTIIIPLFSFLNIFDSNMQNVTQNDVQ